MSTDESVADSLTLRCPFTMTAVGSTGAGKTTFVRRLLENAENVFDRPPGKVYYFYREYQADFDDLDYEFIQGMPSYEWAREKFSGRRDAGSGEVPCIVLDDQGTDFSLETANLFSVASHHFDCNVICVVHQLFGKGPAHRLISLNSRYLVVFKNPRDQSAISVLARQVDPGKNARFVSIFKEATARPYSYLFIDLSQTTDDKHRLRSNVLMENDEPVVVYERL